MPLHPTWQQVATIAEKINTSVDGRHLPARQARLGRSRRLVHDGAEHVRRHLVVVDVGRQARQGAGRPAGVQDRARLLRQARAERRREGRGELELQRVPRAVSGRQGRDVVRRDRRRRPARGEGQPGEGQERLSRFAPVEKTKASGWLWSWALAIPKSSPGSDGRLEVHLLGDERPVHQGRRHEDQGRLGVDPARDAPLDLPAPAVQEGRRSVRRERRSRR